MARLPMNPGLSIGELAEITGGLLQLAQMPPLGGPYEPISQIQTDLQHVQPGDVFWTGASGPLGDEMHAEQALMRGALGVVVSDRFIEPWAGRFSLHLDDPLDSAEQLVRTLRRHAETAWYVTRLPRPGWLEQSFMTLIGSLKPGCQLTRLKTSRSLAPSLLPYLLDPNPRLLVLDSDENFCFSEISDLCRPDILCITRTRNERAADSLAGELVSLAADESTGLRTRKLQVNWEASNKRFENIGLKDVDAAQGTDARQARNHPTRSGSNLPTQAEWRLRAAGDVDVSQEGSITCLAAPLEDPRDWADLISVVELARLMGAELADVRHYLKSAVVA